ncbi:MAG: leucine-rich repeat protein [Clostridia bacterium]|nr:leucine-rich repeat protein [Clostridia bacterium]
MSDMFKRVTSVVLAVLILTGTFSIGGLIGAKDIFVPDAQAAEAIDGYFTYEIDGSGNATITKCDPSVSGPFSIPPTLGGCDVTAIGDNAFYNCDKITHVYIHELITRIGQGAFRDCNNLEKVEFSPKSEIIDIENYTFHYCRKLTDINLPDGLLSIGDYAFGNCQALKEIEIPDTTETIGNDAFCWCTSLEKIEIPSTVTTIGYRAFSSCQKLADVTLNEGLVSIGNYAFSGCYSLEKIEIPSTVTTIGERAFESSGLKKIEIPASVNSIGLHAFLASVSEFDVDEENRMYSSDENGVLFNKNKTELIQYPSVNERTSYTVPDGVVSVAEGAFINAKKLETVVLPAGLKRIGDQAFSNCSALSGITIPSGVTSLGGGAFSDCDGLTEITIPASVGIIGASAFIDCESLSKVEISDGVTAIGSYAFEDCDALKEIIIPASVETIGYDAFSWCESLTKVTLNEGLVLIDDRAFDYCPKLAEITIPASVTYIGYDAFYGCGALKTVNIGGNKNITIDTRAFRSCNALEAINVDEANAGYSSENGVLFNKDKTALIKYPAGKTETSYEIPDGVETIGYEAFEYAKNLESITMTDSVKRIEEYAFEGCEKLEKITISDNIEYISEDAFYGTLLYNEEEFNQDGALYVDNIFFGIRRDLETPVTEYEIKDGTVYIMPGAFSSMYDLTKVTIPASVKVIGTNAFAQCQKLASVTFEDGSMLKEIGDRAFATCLSLYEINVPDGTKKIGQEAFYGCTNLKVISLPDSTESVACDAFEDAIYLLNTDNWENGVLYIGNVLYTADPEKLPESYEIKADTVCIADMAFYDCRSLKSVVIPDTVKYIGNGAFYNCGNLANANIPTGVVSIGASAFDNCNLKSVTIPASVTAIGEGAFQNCDNLTEVIFEEGNQLEKVEAETFSWCSNLKSISLPSTVTEIGYEAFYYMNHYYSWNDNGIVEFAFPESLKVIGENAFYNAGIKNADIPEGTEEIGNYAFQNSAVETVSIPSTVTKIGENAFLNCNNLTEITVAPENPVYSSENGVLFNKDKTVLFAYPKALVASYTVPASVEKIENDAFYYAKITGLSFAENSKLKEIGTNAFYNCDGLTGLLVLPDALETVGGNAFDNCYGITDISIPASVSSIGSWAFHNMNSLTSITVDADNDYYSSDENGVLFNKDKSVLLLYPRASALTEYEIPASVTEISEYAFYNVSKLSEISFADNSRPTLIGNDAFRNCSSLAEIILPETVGYIGNGAFANCTSLPSIHIPDAVTALNSSTFSNCTSLESITFGDDSRLSVIDSNAISSCNALEEITIPARVKSFSYGKYNPFDDCRGLKAVKVDEDNRYFTAEDGVLYSYDKQTVYCYPRAKEAASYTAPVELTTVANYAFAYNTNLTEITLYDNITYIGYYAFNNCGYYNDASNWENGMLYIGKYLVATNYDYYDDEIPAVPADCTIKEGTLLTAYDTFDGCFNLETLTIPDSLLYLYSDIIYDCYNLKTIYYGGSPTEWLDLKVRSGYSDYYWEELTKKVEVIYGRSDEKATVSDEDTDISIEYYEDIYKDKGEIDINVEKSLDETAFDIISTQLDVNQKNLYDITMTLDGVEIQPTGKVKVRIPVPAGYDPAKTFVYHVDIETGRVEKMNAVVEVIDGKTYLVFETTHFSYYAIVEKVMEDLPVPPPTKPSEPVTKPTEPTTKPTEPSTKPTEPTTRPTEPTTRPTEPTTKPEEPTTKPPVTEPEKPIEIKAPSVTVIRYGDSINLHAKLGRDVGLPEGYYIKWTVNNDNFRVVSTSLDNMSCNITPENNGDSEITVTVYDYNGGVICSDSQTMTAKAGFFQKIFGFLRRIFGLNKEIPALIRKYF